MRQTDRRLPNLLFELQLFSKGKIAGNDDKLVWGPSQCNCTSTSVQMTDWRQKTIQCNICMREVEFYLRIELPVEFGMRPACGFDNKSTASAA